MVAGGVARQAAILDLPSAAGAALPPQPRHAPRQVVSYHIVQTKLVPNSDVVVVSPCAYCTTDASTSVACVAINSESANSESGVESGGVLRLLRGSCVGRLCPANVAVDDSFWVQLDNVRNCPPWSGQHRPGIEQLWNNREMLGETSLAKMLHRWYYACTSLLPDVSNPCHTSIFVTESFLCGVAIFQPHIHLCYRVYAAPRQENQ